MPISNLTLILCPIHAHFQLCNSSPFPFHPRLTVASMSVHPTEEELGDLNAACQRLWELDENRLQPGIDYAINVQVRPRVAFRPNDAAIIRRERRASLSKTWNDLVGSQNIQNSSIAVGKGVCQRTHLARDACLADSWSLRIEVGNQHASNTSMLNVSKLRFCSMIVMGTALIRVWPPALKLLDLYCIA